MHRLRVRWGWRGFITDGRHHLPKSCAAVTFAISHRACLPSGLSFIANPRWSHRLTVARWRSEYAGVMHRPSALVQFQGRAYKLRCSHCLRAKKQNQEGQKGEEGSAPQKNAARKRD
jgi:hypothetical protein